MTKPRILLAVALTAALTLGAAIGVGAQSVATPSAAAPAATDARWTPWLGCWRAVDDLAGNGARVCITRADAGVVLRTIVGGQVVSQDVRVADGTARPVTESGCSGTTNARWSADGLRVYRTATASCGAESPRALASVAYVVSGPIWVDVQTVTLDGAVNVRVSRYARAQVQRLPDGTQVPPSPSGLATPILSQGWTTDDAIEASRVLPADGVQAAIGEGPTAFRLNAGSLSRMADGGVAENVIDLMVALTYPKRFTIDRATGGGSTFGAGSAQWTDPFFAQVIGPAALYDCYANYGWASSGYWAGCTGFNRLLFDTFPGYYNGYGGNGLFGPWVATTAGPGQTVGSTDAGGRLVNGRGYTQVNAIDTSVTSTGSADRSGGFTGSDGSPSGGATSSGYSGGAGTGGGNFAVARPPGS